MKRRILQHAAAVLIFCFCFIVGLWTFAPWELFGRFAIDQVRLAAAKNNMFISYAGIEKSGFFFPTYEIRSLDIDQGMARFSFGHMRIRFLPLSTLMNGGVSSGISLHDGEISFVPDNRLAVPSIDLRLSVTKKTVTLSEIVARGDLRADGGLLIEKESNSVKNSTLVISLPDSLDRMLKNPLIRGQIQKFAEQTADGEWRIKANANPSS